MTRKYTLIGAALAATSLVAAACGSSTPTAATTPSTNAPTTAAAPSTTAAAAATGVATLKLTKTSLGSFLTDGAGNTLYLFEKDTTPASNCSASCATVWPPVTSTAAPVAGAGVNASLIGTDKRADGTTGVTYNGHPLYTFVADKASGDTKGEGINEFGAQWYVVNAAGAKIDNS
jgi:predicted lipoprotein with Yx(FWY)xxD motif